MASEENRTRNWKAIRIQDSYSHILSRLSPSLLRPQGFFFCFSVHIFFILSLQTISLASLRTWEKMVIPNPLICMSFKRPAENGSNSKFLKGDEFSASVDMHPFLVNCSWTGRVHAVQTKSKEFFPVSESRAYRKGSASVFLHLFSSIRSSQILIPTAKPPESQR